MILTSNFKIAGHLPQAVAISLGVPRGWRGPRCTVLAPPRPLIKIMDPDTFIPLYKAQVLDRLDPHKVITGPGRRQFHHALLGGPREFCHRRVVAAWMRKHTGMLMRSLSPAISAMLSGLGATGGRDSGEGIIDQVVVVVRFNRPAPESGLVEKEESEAEHLSQGCFNLWHQVQRPITLSISLGRTVAR